MLALLYGTIAAVCWGIHDILVRKISQTLEIYAAFLFVLIVGTFVQWVFAIASSTHISLPSEAILYIAFSGIAFVIAGLGLYKAFEIGPVKLVAPIIGSYPIVSLALAAFSGAAIHTGQWIAVLLVVVGIGVVSNQTINNTNRVESGEPDNHKKAIIWAMLSGIGFSFSFHLGHGAAEYAPQIWVTIASRLISIAALLFIMIAMQKSILPPVSHFPLLLLMGLMDGVAHGFVISAAGLPNETYAAVAASTFGIITILLAWHFLKEPMERHQWFGVLIVFAAIGYLSLLGN